MGNLINNSADLKKHFSTLDQSFTWANISSMVQDAEQDLIGAAIGAEALDWFRENLTTEDAVQLQALTYLQRALAALAVLQWSQTSLFRMTDKVLYLAKSSDGLVPSDKKLADFRSFCEETGNNFIDKALTLMEDDLAKFTAYAGSTVRQQNSQAFIKTASRFSSLRNINGSRLTYLSLLSIMLDVQDQYLPAYMTPAYYKLYKQRFLAGELAADELGLLPLVQQAVATLTISQACRDLPVKIKGAGIFINRFANSIDYAMQDPAGAAQLQYMQDDAREKGERYLQQLSDRMQGGLLSLPDYAPPASITINVNSSDSGFYSL